MKHTGSRLFALGAVLLAAGLVGLSGCSSSDSVTNPPASGGGAADIDAVSSTPGSGDTNISGSAVSVTTSLENAGATTRVQVDATTGGYLRQVLVYFTTATGAVEHVTYSWGTASLLEHAVYCPGSAASCANASVDTTTKEITLAGVPLDNYGNPGPTDPATEFSTLGQTVPASMVVYP